MPLTFQVAIFIEERYRESVPPSPHGSPLQRFPLHAWRGDRDEVERGKGVR
jgi:hypothetical protein